MSLLMGGHIDAVFATVDVELRNEIGGGYVNGIWVQGSIQVTTFKRVTIQPLNDRELENLFRAGQRIIDGRKLYINNGDLTKLELAQDVWFSGQKWKIVESDIRPWRQYARIKVSRYDQQS